MGSPILDVSYKQNHRTHDLLCLPSFTHHNVFEVHPQGGMYHYFIASLWLNNSPPVYSTNYSSVYKCVGYFHILAILNSAALNKFVQVYL